MPVYQCFIEQGAIDDAQMLAIAKQITDVHTSATGAPASFVNVSFQERPMGRVFTAGHPSQRTIITGYVRAGRDRATHATLLEGISLAWTTVSGQDRKSLLIGLIEVDPTSVMEAGLILPAPGEEAEWLRRHADELSETVPS